MVILDFSRDIGKLRSEVSQLRRDIASYADSVRGLGRERRDELLEHAERLGTRAKERFATAEERLGRTVGERPIIALLAAVGIGFLLAKLTDVRR